MLIVLLQIYAIHYRMFKDTHSKEASAAMRSCLWMVVCFEHLMKTVVSQNLWFVQELVAQNKEKLHSQLLKILKNLKGNLVQVVNTSALYLIVLTVTKKCPPEMKSWTALGMIHPLLLDFKVRYRQWSSEIWSRGWMSSKEINLILL